VRNPRYLGTVQKRKSQVSAQECQRQKEKRRKEEKEEKERQKGKIPSSPCQQIRILSYLAQKETSMKRIYILKAWQEGQAQEKEKKAEAWEGWKKSQSGGWQEKKEEKEG